MTGKDHAARGGYRHGPGLGRSLPGLAAVNGLNICHSDTGVLYRLLARATRVM